MGTKLYVGNLPYSVRDDDLHDTFSEFGAVASAKVMMERGSDRSRGFGFVEMENESEAQAAISSLNDKPMGGRNLVVNEARPMAPRSPRGPGGPGGGGNGGPGGRREGGFRNPYGGGPRGGGGGGGRRGDFGGSRGGHDGYDQY